MNRHGFVIAGTASGVGKTTITVGLIAALRRRGHQVQPFKVGPDYIDTSYHARAAGRPSRNLDLWLLEAPVVKALFARAMHTAEVAVVEGVMGLFDGRLGGEGLASSAHLARDLGLPVILVVDAAKLSWSAGALVLGYRTFDPQLNLAGVILNRVGGPGHVEELKRSIEQRAGVPVLGWLPHNPALSVPERYLGLIPTTEGGVAEAYFAAAEHAVASGVDLDRLMRLARLARPLDVSPSGPALFPETPERPTTAIAVARDQAFSFYYQDSLDLLEAWGAELIPFSPLSDTRLPEAAGGVYLGGGFPELFARDLAANTPMLASLRHAAAHDLAIYGECGGLMLLGRSLVDAEGQRHAMADIVPLDSCLAGQRLTIGYRQATAARKNLLLQAGETVRGHEFHWSALEHPPSSASAAYTLDSPGGHREEGYAAGATLASYLHVHLAAQPRGGDVSAYRKRLPAPCDAPPADRQVSAYRKRLPVPCDAAAETVPPAAAGPGVLAHRFVAAAARARELMYAR
jgi:cobyrinic acid a,c-diamide synthase